VEGQPDAISAGQLGIPAVALAGVAADKELAELLKSFKIERVFMGLDNDPVGQANQVKAAGLFGPMTRLVTWTMPTSEGTDDNNAED
jgi:DNA primase